MKKRSRILASLMALTLAVTSLAGCGGSKKDADQANRQVLRFATNSIIVGMNPMKSSSIPDSSNYAKTQEPVVRHTAISDTEAEYRPGAAESWDVSEDGKTYTFHFRKGMTWSDGEPFTAKDFDYTLKKMADPETGAQNAWLYEGLIKNWSQCLYCKDGSVRPEDIGVTCPDENTLVVELEHPASYFLELMAGLFPVSEKKMEAWGDKYGCDADHVVCSGQFKIQKWDQNTETVYVKNENNWNAKNMKLDGIDLKIIQDQATSIQAFQKGELDECSTADPNWQKKIEEMKGVVDKTVPGTVPEFFLLNLKNPYLHNAKIRQALAIGFDRNDFIDTTLDGCGISIYSIIPDTMTVGTEGKAYHELVGDQNYFVKDLIKNNKDPKKLIEEGLKEMGKDPDPSQITLRFASRGTSEMAKKAAEWFKQTWESNLGINLEVDMMEWNIMWDKVNAGDYDIAVASFGSYYNEPSGLLGLFDKDNGFFNATKIGWEGKDAENYQALLKEAQNMTETKALADKYLEAEGILEKNAVVIPNFLGLSPDYVRDYVKGYYVNPVGSWDYTRMSIDLKQKAKEEK